MNRILTYVLPFSMWERAVWTVRAMASSIDLLGRYAKFCIWILDQRSRSGEQCVNKYYIRTPVSVNHKAYPSAPQFSWLFCPAAMHETSWIPLEKCLAVNVDTNKNKVHVWNKQYDIHRSIKGRLGTTYHLASSTSAEKAYGWLEPWQHNCWNHQWLCTEAGIFNS